MTPLTIIIIVIVVAVILGFAGYYLWDYAEENYGFNIFGIGILVRGLIGVLATVLALLIITHDETGNIDQGVYLLLGISGILFIWNFIITWIRTSPLIAIFAFIYQIIAVYIVIKLINKVIIAFD